MTENQPCVAGVDFAVEIRVAACVDNFGLGVCGKGCGRKNAHKYRHADKKAEIFMYSVCFIHSLTTLAKNGRDFVF